jgi:hypothetical protein
MLMAMIAYFWVQFDPLSAMETVHLVLSAGLGAALARFGFLERRAHRYG